MDSKTFEGVIAPVFIPLDDKEQVIADDLAKLSNDLIEKGVKGILVPSGTGEFFNLTAGQRKRAVEAVARAVKGKAIVISMVTDCGTRNALTHIENAHQAGADAVMADPPYYMPINQKNLIKFFNTLADKSPLPLWLYNQPGQTKVDIEPKTVRELANNPNIVGIKASTWVDIFSFQQLLRALRDKPDFRVLMGEEINNLSGLILGGHGMVNVMASIVPEICVAQWNAIKNRDIDTARKLQDRITDLVDLFYFALESWQGGAKYVLQKRGIFSTTIVSSPLHSLTEEDVQKIESKANKLKLF